MPDISVIFMLSLLCVMIYLFLTELISIDLTALLGLAVLTFAGFITPKEAFSGFAAPAVITLAAMFVIGAGLSTSGACDILARFVSGLIGSKESANVIAVMMIAAILSAFMNNVAATAVLLPTVTSLASHNNLSPSRLLIPLSFATILGGMCTLIGTSANILIADVVSDLGVGKIEILDFSIIGLAIAIPGIIYMVIVGRFLLPKRELNRRAKARSQDLSQLYRLYERMFSLKIPKGSKLSGKTLAETRFGEVLRVQILSLQRDERKFLHPGPEMVLQENDLLVVQGRVSRYEALRNLRGLELTSLTDDLQNIVTHSKLGQQYRVLDSKLVGHSLRQLEFRDRYNAVVLGIERDQQTYFKNFGNRKLQKDDLLYLIGSTSALSKLEESGLIEPYENDPGTYASQIYPIKVKDNCTCVGKEIRETRLGELLDIRIFGYVRAGEFHVTYDGQQQIQPGDFLMVFGEPKSIAALDELASLEIEAEQTDSLLESEESKLLEVVLSPRSRFTGKTLVETNFREKYGFQVLAIWRGGRPLRSRLASRVLQFGDALLLHGPQKKMSLIVEEDDLVVLSDTVPSVSSKSHAFYATVALLTVIICSIQGLLPVHFSAFIGALIVVVSGTIKMDEVYRQINWRILVLIAALLPLAPAMDHSGTNTFLSEALVNFVGDLGPMGLLITMCLVSSFLSQTLDAVVPVILLTPIAIKSAQSLSLAPMPFLMGIALAASIAFLTPFSHKANLLVMAAGGYRVKDYFKVGFFLSAICFVTLVFCLPLVFPF